MADNNHIFLKVEHAACECAAAATNCDISKSDIYSGRTKTTLGISLARQMAMMFMHDHYGINYRRIAERAHMTVGAVMKCVGKARRYRFSDPLYSLVYRLMDERL